MVIKMKVSDLAKDFGAPNKAIIEMLSKYCDGPAKKASSVLNEEELNILFDAITQTTALKSLDPYFATKKPRKTEKTDKPVKKDAKPKNDAKSKKHQSQAAILHSSSRTRWPLPVPPMAGLQGMLPTLSRFTVKQTVSIPRRAAARAASIPAWPAPITAISHFPASYRITFILLPIL